MFNKIIKELKESNTYFNVQKPQYINRSRANGINEYEFRIDDNMDDSRENIWFFSNEFEVVLKKYMMENNLDKLNYEQIYCIFYNTKDNLKDLSWITKGYF